MQKNALLILSLMAFSLSACGGTPSGGQSVLDSSGDGSTLSSEGSDVSSEESEVSSEVDGFLPTDDPEEPVEINFWHCMNREKSENLAKIVKKFNDANPKYHVTAIAPENTLDRFHELVMTKITAGEVPALCMGYPDYISMYMTRNVENCHILKLDDFFDDPNFGYSAAEKEDFVDAFFEEGNHYQFDGLWSVPMYKSTEIMYYNANWFAGDNPETVAYVARKGSEIDAEKLQAYNDALNDVANAAYYATDAQLAAMKEATQAIGGYTYQVPETWEEMISLAETMVENRQNESLSNQNFYAVGHHSDANLLISQMAQLGIPYTVNDAASKEDPKKHIAFNNADAKDLVQELVDLYDGHILKTTNSVGDSFSPHDGLAGFQSVMAIGPSAGWSFGNSNNFKVKLAPVPYRSEKPEWLSKAPSSFGPKYFQEGPSICFFDNENKYIHKGAWLFYKYLADPVNNANMALENGCEPVRDSSFETDNYVYWTNKHSLDLKYDIPYTTSQLRENYIVSEHFIGSAEAHSQMGRLLNYILAKGRSVEEAFSSAYNICCAAAS